MKRLIILSFVFFGLTLGISSCEYAQGDREMKLTRKPFRRAAVSLREDQVNGRLSDVNNHPLT